jgi:uncharacterized protein
MLLRNGQSAALKRGNLPGNHCFAFAKRQERESCRVRFVGVVLACCIVLIDGGIALPEVPSFDCARAKAADEFTICSSERLSNLDRLVAAGYEFVRAHYGQAKAREVGIPSLQSRHACGADATCIEENQLNAIRQYQALVV